MRLEDALGNLSKYLFHSFSKVKSNPLISSLSAINDLASGYDL
jgi:hypothetical protein